MYVFIIYNASKILKKKVSFEQFDQLRDLKN